MKTYITIKIKEIIKFYDEKENENSKHVSSITAIIGEDLGAGLIKHYFKKNKIESEIIDITPREKVNKGAGKWLDRWIKVYDNETIYYQTEIKNWSSYSKGGKKIILHESELVKMANERFAKEWLKQKQRFKEDAVNKVLLDMKINKEDYNSHNFPKIKQEFVKPLICYWWPILKDLDQSPFFEVDCSKNKETSFKKVYFFSMSMYLRCLLKNGTETINIEAPNVIKRYKLIENILILE